MKGLVLAFAAVLSAQAQIEMAGDWQGTIQTGTPNTLRVILHIAKAESGLTGTLDSIDQGAFGLKVKNIVLETGKLRFELERPAAQYEGNWTPQAGEFRGTWIQNGIWLVLNLKRAPAPEAGQPISAEDREFLLGWLRRTRDAYAKTVGGGPPNRWQYKPSPERWSAAECAEHLILAERELFRTISERIARTPMPAGQKRQGRVEDERVIRRMLDRSKKASAPESERPKGTYAAPGEAMRDFLAARAATVEWVSSTKADLRGNGVQTPEGFLDAYQFLLTLAAHTSRHIAQMEEVLKY